MNADWGKFCALVLLACAIGWLPARAHAAQCSVGSAGLAFGNYDPLSGVAPASNGSISVNCTYTGLDWLFGFNITISLSTGSANSYNPRKMPALIGGDRLNYNLYQDPPHTIVFGDGSGGSSSVTLCFPGLLNNCGGNPSSNPATVPIYGLLPANQDVATGGYSDTILTTVTY